MRVSGTPAAAHIVGRPPLFDVASDKTFDVVRGWINDCDKTHSYCRRSSKFMPKRVIDVSGVQRHSRIRLREGPFDTNDSRYITLSYCWGTSSQDQQMRSTASNLKDHLRGIAISDLPKTIQDAVTVTRKLGVRFLWVDALCVIQDDFSDKYDQMGFMGGIFTNGYLTISAASAAGCGEGFLQQRANPYFPVLYRFPNDEICNVKMSKLGTEYRIEPEPLNGRGWTLQETMLSPRILFYSTIQPYWNCACRSAAGGDPSPYDYFSRTGLTHLLHGFPNDAPPIVPAQSSKERGKVELVHERYWIWVVENYTRRLLTDPHDIMPAIASVAAKYSHLTRDTYLCGLWKGTLARDLLWSTEKKHSRDIQSGRESILQSAEESKWTIPSWSWMSFDGSVTYHHLLAAPDLDSAIDLLKDLKSDKFGRLLNGPLHIHGYVRGVLVPQRKGPTSNKYLHSVPCYPANIWDRENMRYCAKPPQTRFRPLGKIIYDEFDVDGKFTITNWPDKEFAFINWSDEDFAADPLWFPCLLVAEGVSMLSTGMHELEVYGLILGDPIPCPSGSSWAERPQALISETVMNLTYI